jgi:cobalt-zinc-cadmium resistance protein CzcA
MREKIRRPVTMTALTAILGLLPAALSTRIGAQTQRPLAIVVVGGMLTTLFLTRYLMPGVIQLLWSSVAAVGGWVDCPTNCRFPANQKPEAMAVFA